MLRRKILLADIIRVKALDGPATKLFQQDLVTGPSRAVGMASLAERPAYPFIIDTTRGRTLYLPNLDAQRLREAPFVNLHARTEATSLLSVPWEAGSINRPKVQTDAIYVFSSGRCGSTLLHNILISANVKSVSEPDIGGALISPAYGKYALARPLLRWATRTFLRDLMSALSGGEPLVIKLRSQFCRVAPTLMQMSREKRTIFMIRRFESWAQSVAQRFNVTPAYLVQEYKRSLECYAYLRQHSNCHFLRYEDLKEHPHREIGLLAEFLGQNIPKEAIEKTIAVGSQKGTRLERASERGQASWEAMKEETFRRWKSSGTAELFDPIL